MIVSLLTGSAFGLFWGWQPWHLVASLRHPGEDIFKVRYSSDGQKLLTASYTKQEPSVMGWRNYSIQMWNLSPARVCWKASSENQSGGIDIVWAKEDSRVLEFSGTRFNLDHSLLTKILDARNGKTLYFLSPDSDFKTRARFMDAAYSRNGEYAAPNTEFGQSVDLENLIDGSRESRSFPDYKVCGVHLSTCEGEFMAIAESDSNLLLKRLFLGSLSNSHVDCYDVSDMGMNVWPIMSPDRKFIAVSGQESNGQYRCTIIERATGSRRTSFDGLYARQFTDDGKSLVLNSKDTCEWLNLGTVKTRNSCEYDGLGFVLTTRDSKSILVCRKDWKRVVCYSIENGTERYQIEDPEGNSSLRASYNGDTLAMLQGKPRCAKIFREGKCVFIFPNRKHEPLGLDLNPTCDELSINCEDEVVEVWRRRRPEFLWGVAWLPEFWLTVVFSVLLVWSFVRDFRTLRARKPEQAATP